MAQIPVANMVKDFKQWLDNVTSWPDLTATVQRMSSDIDKNLGGTTLEKTNQKLFKE